LQDKTFASFLGKDWWCYLIWINYEKEQLAMTQVLQWSSLKRLSATNNEGDYLVSIKWPMPSQAMSTLAFD
jgi:hypothetical protein